MRKNRNSNRKVTSKSTKKQNAAAAGHRPVAVAAIATVAAAAAVTAAAGGVLAGARWAYRTAFCPKEDRAADPHAIPAGKQYQSFEDQIHRNVDKVLEAEFEPVEIWSRDGLRLYGRYYTACRETREDVIDDAADESRVEKDSHVAMQRPLALFFHGYRSPAQRDGCGGFEMMREMGIDVLMVDQRAHGQSEGETITLGIKEQYDCLDWIRYCVHSFGSDRPMVLVGISMGAATVLLATGHKLPACVKGVVADCGYSSVKRMVKQEIGKMGLPKEIGWRLVKLGARVFGGFDPEEGEVAEALTRCKIPVLLIHGREDRFVPWEMSAENYDAISGEKELLTVPDAGHGMSWYLDQESYRRAVKTFCEKVFSFSKA